MHELMESGDSKRILRIVKIEAGQAMNRYVVINLRVGWTRDNLHDMAEVPERPAQVFQINPLTAAVRVAAIA